MRTRSDRASPREPLIEAGSAEPADAGGGAARPPAPSLALARGAAADERRSLPAYARSLLPVLVAALFLFLPDLFSYGSFAPRPRILALALFTVALCVASRPLFAAWVALAVASNLYFLHVVHHWGYQAYESRIALLLESPPSEALEYLRTYCSWFEVLLAGYAALASAALWKAAQAVRRPRLRIRLSSVAVVAALGLALFRHERVFAQPVTSVPVHAIWSAESASASAARNAYLAWAAPPPLFHCSVPYQHVVIVLGESASRDHLGLFGYARPTSPEMEAAGAVGIDSLSVSNLTRISVPIMFTGIARDRFAEFFRTPSLVGTLKRCGYATYWVSNQASSGVYDSYVTSIGLEADEHYFSSRMYQDGAGYDEALLDRYRALAAGHPRDERQAVFFHLLGSHQSYADRVPEAFPGADGHGSVLDRYDRSIRYTDHVLGEILRAFPQDSLLFVYVSDHGEVIGAALSGHGFIPSYQEEYRNALLAWSSQPERLRSLVETIDGRRLNTESFAHVVAYLLGSDADLAGLSFGTTVLESSETRAMDYAKLAVAGQGS